MIHTNDHILYQHIDHSGNVTFTVPAGMVKQLTQDDIFGDDAACAPRVAQADQLRLLGQFLIEQADRLEPDPIPDPITSSVNNLIDGDQIQIDGIMFTAAVMHRYRDAPYLYLYHQQLSPETGRQRTIYVRHYGPPEVTPALWTRKQLIAALKSNRYMVG